MTLTERVAAHLPFLRRYSRAITGSQTSGDAFVAATLEALIADISIFPNASSDRVALYKLFARILKSASVEVPQIVSPYAWEKRAVANLASSPGPAIRYATSRRRFRLLPTCRLSRASTAS